MQNKLRRELHKATQWPVKSDIDQRIKRAGLNKRAGWKKGQNS